jgi:hypothetical protein
MTTKTIILTLAAAGGLAGGAAAGESADRASGPRPAPRSSRRCPRPAPRPPPPPRRPGASRAATAALRSAAPPGARLVLVCGAADAQAAVVRLTAEGYTDVLWSGPEPRAAAGLVAPDHPATRYAPLAEER